MLLRAFALLLCLAILVSLAPASLALAEGREEGSFPNRTFFVTRVPGPPRPSAYVMYLAPPAPGEWSVRLVQPSGGSVTVRVYDLRTSPEALLVESTLRSAGQESTPVRLERDISYRIAFTPQGRPGTSVLAEQFRYETNTPPVACFTVYPSPATQNEGVGFNAGCSTDPERDIVAYEWDLGDGQTDYGPYIIHVYRSFGTFTATLRVRDAAGNENGTSQAVIVYADRSAFDPPHADFGLDEDGNGLYDVLVVQVRLAIGARDPYVDAYGRYYRIKGSIDLEEGSQSVMQVVTASPGFLAVDLRFDGVGFRLSGRPGPYLVNLSLEHPPTNAVFATGSHLTQAYAVDAFEDRPARFEEPHVDAGNDTDGDGRFDALIVDVGVRVTRGGFFRLVGDLWDADRTRHIGSVLVDVVLDPGRRVVPLSFPGWTINTSDVDGPYRVEANLAGQRFVLDSTTIPTQPYARTAFNGPPASFFGAHEDRGIDADGDGLYESLEVNASIVATRPIGAQIGAGLVGVVDGNASWYIETVFLYRELVEGIQHVPILFQGTAINESRIDGPYLVELGVYALGGFDQDRHTTRPYASDEFLGPVARLEGDPSDYGLDTDGDGLFNYLVVEVPVRVNVRAELSLFGHLDGINLGAANVTTFPIGLHRIVLRFDGVAIRAHGVEWAFSLRYWLRDNGTREELGMGTYVTARYSYAQFEEPPAVFAPPHADRGLDTDGDGLFNYLVVEVRLQISVPDTYALRAALELGWPTYGTLYAHNESALAVGSATLLLLFDGVFFRLLGQNRTFYVSLTLWSGAHPRPFTSDFYATRVYGFAEFEELPFVLAAPHSDRGVDTDGDGLFNRLVVGVRITAFADGLVSVIGILRTSRGSVSTSNGSLAAAGAVVVNLSFEGWRLRDLAADGPYAVDLVLSAGPYGELGRDRHTTAGYRAAEFDPLLTLDLARATDRGEDPDGDGAIDFLAIDVPLELEAGGTYRAEAFIAFPGGRYLSASSETSSLDAGRATVTVRFLGMALWGVGIDGPYLVNLTVQRFFSHTVRAEYVTGPYERSAFEVPPATFVPPFSETPVDTDGDGLVNLVVVGATIDVREAGNYTVSACIGAPPSGCRASAGASRAFDPGMHEVRLEVLGGVIATIGADGPYVVALRVSPTPAGTTSPAWSVYATFETRPYRQGDFDPLVALTSIRDEGVDTNGNGRYEWLEIRVELALEVATGFTLEAHLDVGPAYPVYRRVDGYGGPGTVTVNLTYEAWHFNTTGIDGPYAVRITIVTWVGVTLSETYWTAPYRAADFEG